MVDFRSEMLAENGVDDVGTVEAPEHRPTF